MDLGGIQVCGDKNERHGTIHPAIQVALNHVPRLQTSVLVVHLVAGKRPQLHDYHIVEDICKMAINGHHLRDGQRLSRRPTAVYIGKVYDTVEDRARGRLH